MLVFLWIWRYAGHRQPDNFFRESGKSACFC
nr:MAG TPA: hypothetical protein [Caudoviricetes sp.]